MKTAILLLASCFAAGATDYSFTFANITRPAYSPNLVNGDSWAASITGPPNSAVTVSGSSPNGPLSAQLGTTDSTGLFTMSALNNATPGTWVETWAVAGYTFPTLTFTIQNAQPPGVMNFPTPGSVIVQNGSSLTFQWGALASPYTSFSYCVSVTDRTCYTLDAQGNGLGYQSPGTTPNQSGLTTASSLSIPFNFIPANTPTTVYVEIEGNRWDGSSEHAVMLTQMTFQLTWTNGGYTFNFANLSRPAATPNLVNGDTWSATITGPANSPVTVTGSSPSGPLSITLGNTDATGHYSIAALNNAAVGTWVEYWAVGGYTFPPLTFAVIPSGLTQPTSTASVSIGTQDSGVDDTTGNTVTLPDPTNPLPAMISVHLPSGRNIAFPSAAGVPLSKFAYSWKDEGGKTRYTYTLDNHGIWMFRVSDDPRAMNSSSDEKQPKGWAPYGAAFGAYLPDALRSTDAEYSYLSAYRPGLVGVYFQNENAAGGLPYSPDSHDGAAIAEKGHILANSTVRFAIGPAFPPGASQATVRAIVEHWVEDLGFTFLQAFLESGKLDAVQPSSKLEQDVVDCLRSVL